MKNNKADISLIRKYLRGELDPRAMYELERQAQDDPIVMDMINGVEHSQEDLDKLNLMEINRMIRKRVDEDKSGPAEVGAIDRSGPSEQTVRTSNNYNKNWKVWMAAASLLLLSSIGILLGVKSPSGEGMIQNAPLVQNRPSAPASPQEHYLPIAPDPQVQSAQDQALVKDKNSAQKDHLSSAQNGHRSLTRGQLQQKDQLKSKSKSETVTIITSALPDIHFGLAVLSRKQINLSEVSKPDDTSLTLLAKAEPLKVSNSNSLNDVRISGTVVPVKESTTASVTIGADRKLNVDSFGTALAGKVAGVNVANSDKDFRIRIRGTSSVKIISGVVTDKSTNQVIPGAAVRIPGETKGISTDPNGKFSLVVPLAAEKLLVSVVGYAQQEFKINPNDSVHVAMSPDAQALSEVVVVSGYRTPDVEESHPLIRWSAYKKYLKENATTADGKGGKVTVAFNIDAAGIPENLHIVEGKDSTLNQKAIQLILNGSRWIRNTEWPNKEVILRIKFR